MNPLIYLITAHFVADFPLQSNWLVRYKQNHLLGIFLHSLIQMATSALFMSPFLHLSKVWLGIGVIFITHNIFDQAKVMFRKYTKANAFVLFVLDQISHLVVIYLVATYMLGTLTPGFTGTFLEYYSNTTIISFILILVLVTYFFDIARWTFFVSKHPKHYKRDYRMMKRNALIVLIAFLVYWASR